MIKINNTEYKNFGEWWLSLSDQEAMGAYSKCAGDFLSSFSLRGMAARSNKLTWDKYLRIEASFNASS